MTRELGLIAFAAAAVACAFAATFARPTPGRRGAGAGRWWLIATAAFALLWIDILVGTRFDITDLVRGRARDADWYDQRRGVQTLVLLLLAPVAAAVAGWWIARAARAGGVAVALAHAGLAVVLAAYAVEIVSWHHAARVLYVEVGGAKLIGWVWAAGAALAVAGAMVAGLRRSTRP
ncbi:MAG: hypothetical protein WD009_02685 [Phycisphaeraceae bacterium]